MNADCPLTVRTPTNGSTAFAAVEREPWYSSVIPGAFDYPNRRVPAELNDDQLNAYNFSRGVSLLPGDRPIRMQFWEWVHQHIVEEAFWVIFHGHSKHILCMSVCPASKTNNYGNGIILMLSTIRCIESAWCVSYGLELSGILSWAPICYLTSRLLNNILTL
jgi:hypothetical protein